MPTDVILLPGGVMPAGLAYGPLIESLGGDVRAIAKDLEVYAGAASPADYSLDYEVEGVLRTADAAGFKEFHLVGYSGGGASSLAFAAAHPERLRSLALIEPAWMGNEGLSSAEAAVWREFDKILALPGDELMAPFVRIQLAPGVEPPPPPPGPPPAWMASRPAGLRAFLTAFRASQLDVGRLSTFTAPVYYAFGGRSNPDYYGEIAKRAESIFPNIVIEVFEQRHHFDPPHRIEPERTARSLRTHWSRTG